MRNVINNSSEYVMATANPIQVTAGFNALNFTIFCLTVHTTYTVHQEPYSHCVSLRMP